MEAWRKPHLPEWGNSLPWSGNPDFEQHVHRVLHLDAARCGLSQGSRYEIREWTNGTGQLVRGWYRNTDMDQEPEWGNASGPREGYVLIGQFLTPANEKGK